MEIAMKRSERRWLWIVCALLALIGGGVLIVGVMEHRVHLVFGGVMFWVLAAVALLHERALRPGRDDNPASNAEKAAWSMIGMGLAAIMVLGGVLLGSMRGSMASYLLFFAYALIVAFFPVYRRRFADESRRYREVAEDERDRVIRAQGDYLSKRMLEIALVVLACAWVIAPRFIQAISDPLQVAALLLLPVLAANVAGEARIARLYWRDRQ